MSSGVPGVSAFLHVKTAPSFRGLPRFPVGGGAVR
jgi:hypothetical protein